MRSGVHLAPEDLAQAVVRPRDADVIGAQPLEVGGQAAAELADLRASER